MAHKRLYAPPNWTHKDGLEWLVEWAGDDHAARLMGEGYRELTDEDWTKLEGGGGRRKKS